MKSLDPLIGRRFEISPAGLQSLAARYNNELGSRRSLGQQTHSPLKPKEEANKKWADKRAATPSAITGLFVQAINEVIDVHAKRVMLGTRSTIPAKIWACLYFVAALGLASAGFQSGGRKAQNKVLLFAVVLTFALVLTLVTDLDHPGRGLLKTDQSPMMDLAGSLSQDQ